MEEGSEAAGCAATYDIVGGVVPEPCNGDVRMGSWQCALVAGAVQVTIEEIVIVLLSSSWGGSGCCQGCGVVITRDPMAVVRSVWRIGTRR